MPIARQDVGCWVVRGTAGSPASSSVFSEAHPQEWCLARTYRTGLIEPGDLIVRYLGGQKTPAVVDLTGHGDAPGLRADPGRGLGGQHRPVAADVVLPRRQPVARQVLKDDPDLSGCELIRLGRAANPLHLTPTETLALAAYLTPDDLERADWTRRLAEDPFTPPSGQD